MRKSLFLSSLLLAGCATRPPTPAPRPIPPVRPVERPVPTPAQYVAISASRSLLLVRGAELVSARAPGLAAEAERIAAAHRGVAAQLNFAGRRLELLPSAELLPADRLQLEGLAGSADLATAWRRVVGTALANCDAHEADYAERGASPTLRPVARFALGVCREELAHRR